jgi:hypothetical protein
MCRAVASTCNTKGFIKREISLSRDISLSMEASGFKRAVVHSQVDYETREPLSTPVK